MTLDDSVAPDPVDAEHFPVLLDEVLEGLDIQPGGLSIDGTLGGGGHTEGMLARSAPNGRVLGIDADPAAIRRVQQRLDTYIQSKRLVAVRASFDRLETVAAEHRFSPVAAVLLDLGLSSYQLETAARGFSFVHEGPLDMRFDPQAGESAADIVNSWSAEELARVIYLYGEERHSRRIARAIVVSRPIRTTTQLAEIVANAVGGRRGARIHPATRTFQALRITVNDELGQLERVLPQCLAVLTTGGRMAVITFHSLEDRIVKHWMQAEASDFVADEHHPLGGQARTPTLRIVTRKPITASASEIDRNPRSRSAKLRIAARL